MHTDEVTHLEADMHERVSRACSALAELLSVESALTPDERARQVQAFHQALIGLGRDASLLHEELLGMLDRPGEEASFGPTSVVEAGRKGGRTVREKYGAVYYAQIGEKGGQTLAQERGSEYYAKLGRKGGAAVRERHGLHFYAELGKKGGEAVKAKHGPEFYSSIGKKGGQVKRQKKPGKETETA